MSDSESSFTIFTLNERRATLRKYREQANLSLAEVAKLARLSQSMVSKFELGQRDLSPKAYARLEKAIVKIHGRIMADLLKKKKTDQSKVATVETLAGRFVPMLKEHPNAAPLAMLVGGELGDQYRAEYEESCRQMEQQYGPLWRETFKELADLRKEKADLEKRIAELRDLLAVETASALRAVEAKELRERIAAGEQQKTVPEGDD